MTKIPPRVRLADELKLARAIATVETAKRSPYAKAFRILRGIRDDETYDDAFNVIYEWGSETGVLNEVDE